MTGGQESTREAVDLWSPAELEAVLQEAEFCQKPTEHGCGGKTWRQIKRRLEEVQGFREQWNEARERWVDTLERVTQAKAVDGWEEVETVYEGARNADKVKETRVRTKWSPQLATNILASRRPEVYGKKDPAQASAVTPAETTTTLKGAVEESG